VELSFFSSIKFKISLQFPDFIVDTGRVKSPGGIPSMEKPSWFIQLFPGETLHFPQCFFTEYYSSQYPKLNQT